MWLVATSSFRAVDRVLNDPNPEFSKAVQPLGPGATRAVLRHLASEINRTLFGVYGWAQILLGVVLLLLLWSQTPRDITAFAVCSMLLGLAAVLTFFIQPQIVSIGRTLDFVPRQPTPPMMRRFWILHGAFTALDGIKLVAGLGLLVRWLVAR